MQWLFGLVSLLSNAKVILKNDALLMQFRIHVVDAVLYTLQPSHVVVVNSAVHLSLSQSVPLV